MTEILITNVSVSVFVMFVVIVQSFGLRNCDVSFVHTRSVLARPDACDWWM